MLYAPAMMRKPFPTFPGLDEVFKPKLPDGLLEAIRTSMQSLLAPENFLDAVMAMQALARIADAAGHCAALVQTWHPAGALIGRPNEIPMMQAGYGDENFGLAMFREAMAHLKQDAKKPAQQIEQLTQAIKNAKEAGLTEQAAALQQALDKAIADMNVPSAAASEINIAAKPGAAIESLGDVPLPVIHGADDASQNFPSLQGQYE